MSLSDHNFQSIFERLEDRVLFDGVPDGALVPMESELPAPVISQNASAESIQSPAPLELIIIDANVENNQALLRSLIESNSSTAFAVHILDAETDGVTQITDLLAQSESKFQAVHILSHGQSGDVQLGSSSLNNANVDQYVNQLASWSEALTEDADLLFYGCDLAANESGQSLIRTLSAATGADVAASDDTTGNRTESVAADWQLEFAAGRVEATSLRAENWDGTLATEATDGVVTIQDAESSSAGTVTITNDGAPETVTTVGTPQRVGQMLQRVWQFDETGDVGPATFVLDVSGIAGINATIASEFGLIISDQPDFSGTNTTTLVASGYDAANGLVYFHSVDLSSGDYFGLATEVVQDNFTVSPSASGPEDTAIDLGLELFPALTDGGQLRDIIGTEIGFRSSTASTTPTEFLIPAGTTGIKVTGYSTRDIGTRTATNDAVNDDYQRLVVSIDLDTELSNGFISHLIDQGPSRSDQFGWSGAPLGANILTGGGVITGDADDNINPRFSVVDGVLQIVENHQLQTAYHVEFLTNATSSADFINTATGVRENGDQSDISLDIPSDADFLVINIADAATSSNAQVEYKGNSRIYVDLSTLTASGVVAAQRGETDNRVVSYAFEDYDVSSVANGSVLSAAGSVVGDTQQNAGLLNDSQIYIDGSGNLIINRENTFANNFDSLVTVEYYDRKDVGSSAAQLGESTAFGLWNADPSDPDSILEFDIPENATLGILNLSMNGTRTSDTNENMGAGFAVIDLTNGVSSGSIYMVRAGGTTDLVGWDQTEFGTVFFEDPDSISNHATINQFVDKFAGNAVFNLTNGGDTLELLTHSPAGTQSFLDYLVSGQIEWYGSAPLEISGFPADGTFDRGAFNPVTGNWDLSLEDAQSGLSFIPPTHVSGTSPVEVNLIIGDETETTSVRVEAVIDPISFDGIDDACGDEDTDISITANITPIFVDQDGSETVTSLVLSNIPVGHTVTDGTNTFTATATNQTADITAWDQSSIVYRANPNQSGTFTIDLAVNWQDVGGGVTDTDSINTSFDVVVKPANDIPVAVDNNYTVLGNTTLTIDAAAGVLNNDSDVDGDTLVVDAMPVSGPSNGTVTLNADGSFTYVPDNGFSGTDSFEYQISDNNGGFATATAFIDVSERVTGPLDANDDSVTTNEETLINIDVTANDDLPITGAFNIQSTTPPANGTILVRPDGTIDYTPADDFFGTDSFTYTLADASGRTSTATVDVTVLNIQDPPVANADSGATDEDVTLANINILANDSDVDNDPLTVTMATAANGTVTINGDNTIDYTPDPNFSGTDTISYTIADGNGGFASSTVLINVVPVADPPTSADQTVTVDEDSAYAFSPSDFAFADADPGDQLVTVRIDTLPADGQVLFQGTPVMPGQIVSLAEITAGRLSFVPDPDEFGNGYTTFDFSVSDGALFQTTPNTITVNVTPLQDPPVATDNTITVDEASTSNPLGLSDPIDLDGDTLSVTVTGLPTLGTVLLSAGGAPVSIGDTLTVAQLTQLVYDAPDDYAGADPGDFTYDVTDSFASDSGVVDIIITPVNDPPVIDLDTAAGGNDYADTFVEGGPPVALADSSATVTDVDDVRFPSLTIAIDQSTIVDAGDEFLVIGGTDFLLDAVASSTTTINVGGVDYDVSYSPGSDTLVIVRNDMAEMTAGEINGLLNDASYRNDSPLPTTTDRVFNISVNDGDDDSNIATSTILVDRDAQTALWTITGDATVIDGNSAVYRIDLSTSMRDGETASVDLALNDVDTTGADHDALSTAIATAVAGYVGPGSLVFDGTTLTFTSDGTGPMTPLDFSLATTPDGEYEGDEDFTINLSNPASTTGQMITLGPASVANTTIIDNTPPPTVTIDDGSASEGSPVVFAIGLDVPSFEDITLDLSATSGSATAGVDFETTNFEFFDGVVWQSAAAGTQVTLPAGTTTLLVRVDSVQDGDVEPDETFTLSASVVSGTVTNASDTATGTIVNDDVALISIDDVSVDEDNGTIVFTVSLDQPATGTVAVDWATASGSATSGIDFAAASGTVTFPPATQTQTITININEDATFEGPENFAVTLSNASGGTVVDDTGVGTIFDDGNGPNGTANDIPAISIDDVTATEDVDPHAVFTIALSNPSTEAIELSLALVAGSATSGSDFGPGLEFFDGVAWQPVVGNVIIAAGDTTLQVRTPIIDDAVTDSNETFSLVVTQVSGTTANAGDTGTGTILDDPTPDTTLVSLTGDATVTEGGSANYNLTLTNTPLTDVTITFTYTGTAVSGVDFSGIASVTIPAGQTTASFNLATIDDSLGEPLESFTIAIDGATGGSLEDLQIAPGNFSVTTDIIDDDIPTIGVSDVLVSEGSDTFAQFTVELSNPTFEDITFDITATGVTATGNGVDFEFVGPADFEFFDGTTWIPATSTTIAAGNTTVLLRTLINDDALAEPVEVFNVEVTTTAGTTLNPSAVGVGTIQDDTSDPETILVSLAGPGTVVEGQTTTDYNVSLRDNVGTSINAAEDVTVSLTYSGTATDGSDFTSVATVVIPAGSDSVAFTLPTVDDALFEGDELIVVTIDSVAGGGFEAIGIDPDDDEVTTSIIDAADIPAVSVNDVAAVEGTDDFAVFTVELSNLSVQDVSLSLALADNGAEGLGVDFGAAAVGNLQVFDGTDWVDATTATIPAGEFFVQVRTPIVDDAIDEPDEDYSLVVSVTAGTTTNLSVTGTGTIIDNDAAPDVTIDNAAAIEGSPLVFDVSLSNPSSEPIVLDFSAAGLTATNGSDFLAAGIEFSADGGMTWIPAVGGSEVTIAAESNGVLVRVLTVDNVILESTETIELAIDSVVSGVVGNTTDTATGTISDDDSAVVSIIANDAGAGEPGNDGQFTVTMTQPSDSPTVIQYAVTGAAASAADFAAIAGTITLAAGQTVATIDLNVIDDVLIEGNEDVTVTLTAISSGDPDITIDSANDSDTAIIADDDVATWELTGAGAVNEGAVANYQLNLVGTLAAGESASVELSISDLATDLGDYASFDASVAAAVAAYSGPGAVVWDGMTLTFTSDGTGEMAQLNIGLMAVNDAVVEGPENYTLAISSPTSSTGAAVVIDAANALVTTEIQDTIDAVGTSLDKATWSILGAASVDESQSALYVIGIDAELQDGEIATVDVGLNVGDTSPGDLATLGTAINDAVAAYNLGSQPGSLAFDGATLAFTSDGTGPMGDLEISLLAVADGFLEGAEDFSIQLSNAQSSTGSCVAIASNDAVTTTINPESTAAIWSIGVDNGSDEGGIVQYDVQLAGALGAGESAAVDLVLSDIDTNSGDYADFVAAVNTAVADYSGAGNVGFDGTVLTFTASDDGDTFAGLNIQLDLTDDVIVEGVETFAVDLANATGPTGVSVAISSTDDGVVTTINDTVGVGGGPDQAIWSVTGPGSGDEGTSVPYVVSLQGQLGQGETAAVQIDLNDLTTNASDYDSVLAAATAAAGANPDVTFDAMTGTFTFTAPTDGATMADLVIDLGLATDAVVEGDEDFEIRLSSASSTTGAAVAIGADDRVTTTIIDQTTPLVWAISGPPTADEGDGAVYFVTLQGQVAENETASVVIGVNDATTNAGDYADFDAAVMAAIAGRPEIVFDAASGTLTFTSPSEGATLAPLVIELGITDDVFVEGVEAYSIDLTSPASSTGAAVEIAPASDSVVTQINDTQDLGGPVDGPARWSIVGDLSVAEGSAADYTISLSEVFGAGEVVSVELRIADSDTSADDYQDFIAAVNAAVDGYSGDGTVSFDGTTLVFTAINDGDSMDDLSFTLPTNNDSIVEGPENFSIRLTNPATTTGASIATEGVANSVTTTIADDDQAVWTITGDTVVDEGNAARYTVALSGTLQQGETALVALTLTDVDTGSTDYANFVAAVNAAIGTRTDLSFDGTTLTFTSDGLPMEDLVIDLVAVDDVLVEGVEDYRIAISSASSTSGSDISIGSDDLVTTTINDNDQSVWTITGDTLVDEGNAARYAVALSGVLQQGETALVALTLTDVDTGSTDYANFVAAVNAAIGTRTDLSFDGTTLTFTSDGSPMEDLVIDLVAVDDVLVEGVEDYRIAISSASSSSGSDISIGSDDLVTTTINDNDQSVWTITGDTLVDEGNAARYAVALSGVLQQGETALVALTLTDVDTGSTDYANFVAAVNAAIGTRTDLSFDGTTLTFTSDGSPMEDLVIDLVAVDDVLVEGVEDYRIAISSASSNSGSDISIGSDDLVTTTINDNDAVQWNIVGDAEVDEGGGAVYRISIDGVLQAGENSTVQVDFSDIETDVFDAENLFNAITAAVASRPELSFDPATGRLTATGTGQPITELIVPLTARDDSVIEGPESFEIQLTDSASTSGVATGIDAVQDRVTTTINDTVGDGGSMERAIWSLASDQIVLEGAASNFQLSLQGNLQAGEVVTVELGLNDVTTTGSDYGGFSAAVADAVAGYAGPGSVAWDGATLSFTSDGSGPMADLFFSLDTVDDGFGEGPEDFDVVISNAGSVSGAGVAIDGQANTATTTIDDSVGPNADAVTWSIIGDSEIDEGGIARYTLFTTELGGGESTTVDIVAINVDTSGADYADFSAAVLAAVDAYNTGANPGTASFDGTSLTFTADADGQALDGFEIELPATDDSLAEGPEVVRIELTNVSSSTGVAGAVESAASAVATTIRDTVGVGGPLDPGGQWSLIGDAVVDEGSFANYTITVSGQLQSGEQSSVELVISDIDTTANDYRLLSTAVADAVASYNADSTNSGSLAWDGTTLTFTSTGDGPMDNLVIAIGASDDRLAEGPEQFNLSLVNPSSSTGINASISSSENQVITTIIDNDQPLWSITGPTVTSEGADAVFTVSLGGTLQAGQNVAIEIDLADLETDSSDYGDFFAAIQTAAASNPDVTFDSFTGTIEYTAPADGATMADLVIVLPIAADSLSESPERFTVGLTGASSSGGLMPTVDTDNATVTTTINGSPILEDDFEFTGVNVPLVSGVLANDSDPDGDQLQVVAVNGTTIDGDIATANGNVRFNANGSYTYTPNDDFSGIDSFVYTVVDEAGNRESATVEIAVNRAAIGIAKSAADAVVNAANPDLWDVTFVIVVENLGDVSLDQLVLLDDINAMVGDAFVSASLPVIDGFVGSGAIPSVNGDWAGDTSQNILMGGQIDPGDRFEVTFTATIDLGQGNLLQGLSNQATASGQGINPDSTPMRNSDGTPVVATDVSDQGSDPASENGVVATDDGVAGNDATEILIADLGIAKSIAETPVLLDNGNYQVTFEVVVANTGTVDLASLTLEENLERQFGDALVNVGPLQLTRPPADPFSNINLNENFDGFSQPDFVDGVYNNVLAVGDSFAVTLTIELNPLNVGGNLSNQVAGAADAVNRVGQALTRADGNPLVARDISDSGVDPFTNNSDSADDTGTQSDATSVVLPPVPLGEISGTVFVDANGNQVFDPGERGIEGVEINLTGSDVFGSAVDLTVLTDSQGNYVFTGLNAGLYEVAEVQPQEFIDGADASPSAALVGNDRLAGLRLGFGQQLSGNNFGEGLSGTSGNPASLPPLLNFGGQLLSNRISDFLAGPGPIYSGVAIESNRSPLALDSGRAVSGGYATEFAGPMSENSSSAMAVDGECCQGVEVTEGEWAGVECAESGVAVDEVVQGDGEILCDRCDEEATACQSCQDCGNCCGCGDAGFPQRGGVLHRISNWLRRR